MGNGQSGPGYVGGKAGGDVKSMLSGPQMMLG